MAAMTAGQHGRRVLVLDRSDRIGKKILISGGGRCNFTNLNCTADAFLSANPHFARSALARYTPLDFIALVEKHRIAYHEKTLGQLFCDRSARDIVAMLEAECRAAGVRIVLNQDITEVRHSEGFVVHTTVGELSRRRTGRRHWRPLHSKDGRNGSRLSHRCAIRSCHRGTPARAGSAHLAAAGQRALCRPHRSLHRGHRRPREDTLSRKASLHAPRPQRTGHSPDLLVLAAGRLHHH